MRGHLNGARYAVLVLTCLAYRYYRCQRAWSEHGSYARHPKGKRAATVWLQSLQHNRPVCGDASLLPPLPAHGISEPSFCFRQPPPTPVPIQNLKKPFFFSPFSLVNLALGAPWAIAKGMGEADG